MASVTLILTIISGLIIGLSLGLLGAGGAILTVPALIYVVGMTEKAAIAHSLIVVGVIALAGTLFHLRRGQRQLIPRVFSLFAISSIPGAAFGAWIGAVIPSYWQVSVLVVLMTLAAYKMMTPSVSADADELRPVRLLAVGLATGVLTGLVGVGGGFLIVPALVMFAGLTMAQATATSLALIVTNTSMAVLTLLLFDSSAEWQSTVLITLCSLGIAGVIAGRFLSGRVPVNVTRRVFAFCLLIIATVLSIDMLTQLL